MRHRSTGLWRRREIGGALRGVATLLSLGGIALGHGRGRAQPGPDEGMVAIERFAFTPPELEVRRGASVAWINRDLAPHTATAGDGRWDTGTLDQGETRRVTFHKAGRFAYFCRHHPRMRGEIVVMDEGG